MKFIIFPRQYTIFMILFFFYICCRRPMFLVLVHYSEAEFCSCLFLNLSISWSMSFLFSNFVNLILFLLRYFFKFSKCLVFINYTMAIQNTQRHFFFHWYKANQQKICLAWIMFFSSVSIHKIINKNNSLLYTLNLKEKLYDQTIASQQNIGIMGHFNKMQIPPLFAKSINHFKSKRRKLFVFLCNQMHS